MNGRVYDYNLGRFMSVDPVIQSPGNSQSINPYSYIMNNPLAGTDPTGYSAECDDSGSCDIGNIAMDDVENIQVTKDGNMVVNTKDGSSYQVESINGADAKGAFKAAYNAGASPDLMSQGNIAKSSTETSSNMSGSGGGGCGGIFAAAAVACGAMPLPPIAGMADVSGQGKRNEEMAKDLDGLYDRYTETRKLQRKLFFAAIAHFRTGGAASNATRQTLEEAGFDKPGTGYDAHHIVPLNGYKNLDGGIITSGMRKLLKQYNIDINSANNLIWLPKNESSRVPGDFSVVHGVGHRHRTLRVINQRLQIGAVSGGRDGVLRALQSVQSDFRSGVIYE